MHRTAEGSSTASSPALSAKQLGRGVGYKYAHDFPGHHVAQEYVPTSTVYYEPTELGYEQTIRERLKRLRPPTSG